MDGKDVLLWTTYIIEGLILMMLTIVIWMLNVDATNYLVIINGVVILSCAILAVFMMCQMCVHWIVAVD